jgi:hypothetical protein
MGGSRVAVTRPTCMHRLTTGPYSPPNLRSVPRLCELIEARTKKIISEFMFVKSQLALRFLIFCLIFLNSVYDNYYKYIHMYYEKEEEQNLNYKTCRARHTM